MGSKNSHRNNIIEHYELRFAILRSLFGTICPFVQSYSSLYSFTHRHIVLENSLAI